MSNEATLTTLHKSTNWFKATGTVSEMYSLVQGKNGKFDRKPMQIEKSTRDEYVDGKKTGNKISCEKIFGGVVLKSKNGTYDFQVSFASKNADGSENKKWPMALKMLEWNPAIDGNPNEPVSYVTMSGSISTFDSYSEKKQEVYTNMRWNASAKCEHAEAKDKNGNDTSGCSLHIVGLLKSKVWEPDKNDPDDNTGRMLVKIMMGDGKGECFPVDFVVDEEIAEDFNDAFEIGETIDCNLEYFVTTVGGQKKKSGRGVGKANGTSQELSSTYEHKELLLISADPVDEPDELTIEDENGNEIEIKTQWINPKTMKAAMKIREQKLAELKANGGRKPKSVADALEMSKKASGIKKGVKATQDFEDFEDDINDDALPFDLEDDPDF